MLHCRFVTNPDHVERSAVSQAGRTGIRVAFLKQFAGSDLPRPIGLRRHQSKKPDRKPILLHRQRDSLFPGYSRFPDPGNDQFQAQLSR
jgi:hypothetical protein